VVDCCFETANSIGGGRFGSIFCSKMVIMGVELPFSRELGGGDQSRAIACTPDGGRHGSRWSVGAGPHDEAFLLQRVMA